MTSHEKANVTKPTLQDVDHVDVVKKVHADGTVDLVDARAIGGDFQEMPAGYYRSVSFLGTFAAVCCASICAYLGWVLPANTLLLINEDIGPSPNLNWVATVWTLGTAVGFILVGRLSDIFGRKWMVLGTEVLGLIGCIIGAVAQDIDTLIGANLCNGLAAAAQLSFGIIIGELVPNKLRGPAITLIFLSSLPFAVFGPIIARTFITKTAAGWRWSYYLGIILNAVSLILYQFLYHPPKYTQLHVGGKTKWQQFKELDFVGIVLFCVGTVLFLIGLSWGGALYPWKSAAVICTLVIGGLTLVAFGLYEQYIFKGQALMPPRLFRNVGYCAIVACATIGAMVYYSLTILWPTILSVYTTDVIAIGWQSSVVGGGVLLGQCFGGFGLSYIPKVKIQTVIMSVLGCAFVASLASISADHHTQTIILGIFATVTIGYVDNITFPGVTMIFESQDIGLATGVLGSIRALGGAVAQALYVSILTNKIAHYLPADVTAAATEAGLPASSLKPLFTDIAAGTAYTDVPGMTPKIALAVGKAVQAAYVSSFHVVFYATIPFGVLLIFSACFVPDFEKMLTQNVAKRLQGKGAAKVDTEKEVERQESV